MSSSSELEEAIDSLLKVSGTICLVPLIYNSFGPYSLSMISICYIFGDP